MSDPYAEFGGGVVQQQTDPYAEFGGKMVSPPISPTPTGTISNAPTGPLAWLKNLEGDVRYGTGTTLPGRLLHKIGAPGVGDTGAAETVASPVLGPIKTAQGVAEVKNQPWQGTKDIVGGALQTATIPGSFMGGPAAEAAISKIPSSKFAGNVLEQVRSVAGDLPINVERPGSVAMRIKDIADSGATMPKVIRNFLTRVTDPAKGDLTFTEARDFYSNASSKLSAEEAAKLTPKMKFWLSQFTRELGRSIQETADVAGQGQQYGSAVSEYAAAARNSARVDAAKDVLKNTVKYGVPGAAMGYEVNRILKGGR